MNTTHDEKLEYTLVKLVACMQVSLELFDELKETKIYRHDIKSGINNLSKKLEDHLGMVYHHIDGDQEKEEAFMAIQRAVQQMVATPIEEMYAMGEIVS
jgi:hypothetical protein